MPLDTNVFQSARALAEQLFEARSSDGAPNPPSSATPSSRAPLPSGRSDTTEADAAASADEKRSLAAVTQGHKFKKIESLSAAQVLEPLHTWAGKRLEADVLRKFYRSSGYREVRSGSRTHPPRGPAHKQTAYSAADHRGHRPHFAPRDDRVFRH